jgi:hypothetical protein
MPGSGVTCANFGKPRRHEIICLGMWHGSITWFPVLHARELDDAVLGSGKLEADPNRLRKARDGDHPMYPFQCDVCDFRNIQGRSPGDDHRYKLL